MIDTRVYTIVCEGVLSLEVQTHLMTSDRFTVFLETIGSLTITPEAISYYRWATRAQSAQTVSEVAGEELKVAQLVTALCQIYAREFRWLRAWLLEIIPHEGLPLDTLIVRAKAQARVSAQAA